MNFKGTAHYITTPGAVENLEADFKQMGDHFYGLKIKATAEFELAKAAIRARYNMSVFDGLD